VKQRQRERAIHLVCITDDGITAHGIFDDLLLVQLKLEIVVRGDFKISASNHTCIEGLASKVRPQVIRDLHAKTHEQFCPFAIDGDVSGVNVRHWKLVAMIMNSSNVADFLCHGTSIFS